MRQHLNATWSCVPLQDLCLLYRGAYHQCSHSVVKSAGRRPYAAGGVNLIRSRSQPGAAVPVAPGLRHRPFRRLQGLTTAPQLGGLSAGRFLLIPESRPVLSTDLCRRSSETDLFAARVFKATLLSQVVSSSRGCDTLPSACLSFRLRHLPWTLLLFETAFSNRARQHPVNRGCAVVAPKLDLGQPSTRIFFTCRGRMVDGEAHAVLQVLGGRRVLLLFRPARNASQPPVLRARIIPVAGRRVLQLVYAHLGLLEPARGRRSSSRDLRTRSPAGPAARAPSRSRNRRS